MERFESALNQGSKLLIVAAVVISIWLAAAELMQWNNEDNPFSIGVPLELALKEITPELTASAEAGDATAQFELAILLAGSADLSVRGDYVSYFERSAAQGNMAAAAELGNALLRGEWGFEKKEEEALRLLRLAASSEDIASYNLGTHYRGKYEDELAARYFKMSAELGYPPSQMSYALIATEGVGVERGDGFAAHAFRTAFRQEYSFAGFLNDNLISDSGVPIGGVAEKVAKRLRHFPANLLIRYPHAIRCIALERDFDGIGFISDFSDDEIEAIFLELSNEQPNEVGEIVIADFRNASQQLQEFSTYGGKIGDVAPDNDVLFESLIRVAAVMGDPIAQEKNAEILERAGQIDASQYWDGRASRNPRKNTSPKLCQIDARTLIPSLLDIRIFFNAEFFKR